jgi:hypothetical protein
MIICGPEDRPGFFLKPLFAGVDQDLGSFLDFRFVRILIDKVPASYACKAPANCRDRTFAAGAVGGEGALLGANFKVEFEPLLDFGDSAAEVFFRAPTDFDEGLAIFGTGFWRARFTVFLAGFAFKRKDLADR